MRLAVSYDTDGAMLTLGEARLAAAIVEGLLGRTYFRNSADAVSRAGTATSGLAELDLRLIVQATELARRGAPVDATPEDMAS
jgi:hypothetical protein